MSSSRMVFSTVGACATLLLAACGGAGGPAETAAPAAPPSVGNPITGAGLPNPAPNVTRNWGQLPAGRSWGTTSGIDIDPIEGNVWAYERCGAVAGRGARR